MFVGPQRGLPKQLCKRISKFSDCAGFWVKLTDDDLCHFGSRGMPDRRGVRGKQQKWGVRVGV